MYPALTDLLVTFRYTHIKIEELYNSQNLNAIYIYTYSNMPAPMAERSNA